MATLAVEGRRICWRATAISLPGVLVAGAGVTNVVFRTDVWHFVVTSRPMAKTPDAVDLTEHGVDWLIEPWRTLFGAPDRTIVA